MLSQLLTYVLQEDMHNRLTPRVIDIAYTAFMAAKTPNNEDGGPSDWFTDTLPLVQKLIEKLRKELEREQAERGDVVITWNEDGTQILAVTRQDEEGRILSVIAEAPKS